VCVCVCVYITCSSIASASAPSSRSAQRETSSAVMPCTENRIDAEKGIKMTPFNSLTFEF